MLDTRTTIRNFLDLQFDLEALIRGVHDLEDDGTIVTIRWSDGSLDKVPTYKFYKAFVGSMYGLLTIGNVPLSYAYSGLNIDGKLSSKIVSAVTSEINFRNCNIKEVVAQYVILNKDVQVTSLDEIAELDTKVLNVQKDARIGKIYPDVLSARTMDTTGGVCTVETVKANNTSRAPMDSYLYWPRMAAFRSLLVIDGPMKTYDASISDRSMESIYVYAPYVSSGTATMQVAGSNEVPEGEYPRYSVTNLSLLYPYKSFGRVSSTELKLEMLAPRDEDQHKVVTVRNVSDNEVTACNVWTFSQDSYEGQTRTRVTSISTVTIPAYSAIDFIFFFTYSNDVLYAYMLPTKALT